MIEQRFNYADSTVKEMTDISVENLDPKDDKKKSIVASKNSKGKKQQKKKQTPPTSVL